MTDSHALQNIETQFAEVRTAVTELTGLVTQLTAIQTDQIKQVGVLATAADDRAKRARFWSTVAVIGLVFDVLLTFGSVYLVAKANSNSDHIRQSQAVLVAVQDKQKQALCPLLDIILSNYNPKSPNALANPALYERTFRSYESAATTADCAHRTRGPAK
jgi:hypothetical protein